MCLYLLDYIVLQVLRRDFGIGYMFESHQEKGHKRRTYTHTIEKVESKRDENEERRRHKI